MRPGPVICIGGANVDIKAACLEKMVAATSNPGTVSMSAGGVARNIAHNLARLGVPVSLISGVGRDALGDGLLAETARAGVDVSLVLRSDGATGAYCAVLDSSGELVTAVNAMAIMDSLSRELLQSHADRLERAQLLVADCNLPERSLAWLVAFAAEHRLRLVIDPVSVAKCARLRNVLRGRSVYAVTPNRAQAEALSGLPCRLSGEYLGVLERLRDMGIENVVLHLDREGAIVSAHGEASVQTMPARAAGPVRDVTGAGDAAIAGLVYGLLRGETVVAAARYGQAAAALAAASERSVAESLSPDALESMLGEQQR